MAFVQRQNLPPNGSRVAGLYVNEAFDYNAPYTVMGWLRTAHRYSGAEVLGSYFSVARFESEDPLAYKAWDAFGAFQNNLYASYYGVDADTAHESVYGMTSWTVARPYAYSPDPAQTHTALLPYTTVDPLFSGVQLSSWYHYAVTRNGRTVKYYFGGQLYWTLTLPENPFPRLAANRVLWGVEPNDKTYGAGLEGKQYWRPVNMKLAYARTFVSELTQAQIQVEMGYTSAGGLDGAGTAWGDWPLVADYGDVGSAARHLTELVNPISGTYTFDADFPAGVVSPAPPVVGSLRGSTRAFPQLAANAGAFPQLGATPTAFPQLGGIARAYIRPE